MPEILNLHQPIYFPVRIHLSVCESQSEAALQIKTLLSGLSSTQDKSEVYSQIQMIFWSSTLLSTYWDNNIPPFNRLHPRVQLLTVDWLEVIFWLSSKKLCEFTLNARLCHLWYPLNSAGRVIQLSFISEFYFLSIKNISKSKITKSGQQIVKLTEWIHISRTEKTKSRVQITWMS